VGKSDWGSEQLGGAHASPHPREAKTRLRKKGAPEVSTARIGCACHRRAFTSFFCFPYHFTIFPFFRCRDRNVLLLFISFYLFFGPQSEGRQPPLLRKRRVIRTTARAGGDRTLGSKRTSFKWAESPATWSWLLRDRRLTRSPSCAMRRDIRGATARVAPLRKGLSASILASIAMSWRALGTSRCTEGFEVFESFRVWRGVRVGLEWGFLGRGI
jgi:hypothetical protein